MRRTALLHTLCFDIVSVLVVLGLNDHGFGIPYIVFGLAAVIGHGLEWRYRKHARSRFRAA
jgi:hypothetical protein